MERLKKGAEPRSEVLSAISIAENARYDWLIEGIEPPFRVYKYPGEELAEVIQCHITDRSVDKIYVVSSGSRYCFVLTTHVVIERPKKPTAEFEHVEILYSDEPLHALYSVRYAFPDISVYAVDMPREQFDDLIGGRISNYELVGWGGAPGILSESMECPDQESWDSYYHRMSNIMPMLNEANDSLESELIDIFRKMPDEKKRALVDLLR
ncbi:MAG TPA: hypothetical protein ENK05_11695 [Gammaproteobacteria bacterium]|nr:hypothetical protein [Gammaproteobacteria bacterium]